MFVVPQLEAQPPMELITKSTHEQTFNLVLQYYYAHHRKISGPMDETIP